jgi:hypothetical protein
MVADSRTRYKSRIPTRSGTTAHKRTIARTAWSELSTRKSSPQTNHRCVVLTDSRKAHRTASRLSRRLPRRQSKRRIAAHRAAAVRAQDRLADRQQQGTTHRQRMRHPVKCWTRRSAASWAWLLPLLSCCLYYKRGVRAVEFRCAEVGYGDGHRRAKRTCLASRHCWVHEMVLRHQQYEKVLESSFSFSKAISVYHVEVMQLSDWSRCIS